MSSKRVRWKYDGIKIAEKLKCNITINFFFGDLVVKSPADTVNQIPKMEEKFLFSTI